MLTHSQKLTRFVCIIVSVRACLSDKMQSEEFLVGTTQVKLTRVQVKKKERTSPNFTWKYRLTFVIIFCYVRNIKER